MPSVAQPRSSVDKRRDLVRRQRRGRLVQDQDARLAEERLGDLDHLPAAERQIARPAVAAVRSRPTCADLRDCGRQAAVVDEAAAPRIGAEADVLGDREMGGEAQLLLHHGDAERGAPRAASEARSARPSTSIAAAVGPQRARQQVDQRALAGAVLAEQGVDAAGHERRSRPRAARDCRRSAFGHSALQAARTPIPAAHRARRDADSLQALRQQLLEQSWYRRASRYSRRPGSPWRGPGTVDVAVVDDRQRHLDEGRESLPCSAWTRGIDGEGAEPVRLHASPRLQVLLLPQLEELAVVLAGDRHQLAALLVDRQARRRPMSAPPSDRMPSISGWLKSRLVTASCAGATL